MLKPTKLARVLWSVGVLSLALAACAPEVGSDEWCEDMKNKSKGDWTATETKDFAKHCVLK